MSKASKHATREDWLTEAVALLRPAFKQAGAPLHFNLRVAVGFPPRGFEKIAGICFKREVSKDKKNEIFVSPMVDDPDTAFGILAHELIHAQDNCRSGHGKAFKRVADALLLEGKPTATVAGKAFKQRFDFALAKLGNYPHAALRPSKIQKQGTRMIKCECGDCGYITRTTKKWIDESGAPLCPIHREPMETKD